ncbi:chromosome segregation and condensation protein ScpB [Neokomagataea thailandica NBRC 106555]|uniref:SMC-Scp complex subunit ScpB n=2 Tax=Neokomagataea TaxID=1223423 RepID=A0A4Y6V7S1_9PROT|nr:MULTISPECIES: SMC-Scp complex subunit ScpB [Neokomagataea]QDH25374.1 SMC-Scp complex subunit ScpB [Neokomagataea tanensis]GBR54662.1 chromosome segregation and condensation protein ScpB [Neokomagataea thailandica NBRC 106555]
MNIDQIKATNILEALIFASPEPVRVAVMADVLKSQELEHGVHEIMEILSQRFEGHAIELVEVAHGWQFRTRPEYAAFLTRIIEKPRRLSRSAMETLAVIAYHQPCTRSEIESVRGVALGQAVLDALLEDGLVAPKGRKDVPGRPVLWGTTSRFLEAFGLAGLSALPRREDFLLDRATTEEEESASTLVKPSDEG